MSSLRYILLKSFEKGVEEVNIMVEYDSLESNKIIFKIQNIKFVDKTSLYSLSDIYTFFSLEIFDSPLLLYNLEPEFLIIRKNLLSITDKEISFKENNGKWEMTFSLIV